MPTWSCIQYSTHNKWLNSKDPEKEWGKRGRLAGRKEKHSGPPAMSQHTATMEANWITNSFVHFFCHWFFFFNQQNTTTQYKNDLIFLLFSADLSENTNDLAVWSKLGHFVKMSRSIAWSLFFPLLHNFAILLVCHCYQKNICLSYHYNAPCGSNHGSIATAYHRLAALAGTHERFHIVFL